MPITNPIDLFKDSEGNVTFHEGTNIIVEYDEDNENKPIIGQLSNGGSGAGAMPAALVNRAGFNVWVTLYWKFLKGGSAPCTLAEDYKVEATYSKGLQTELSQSVTTTIQQKFSVPNIGEFAATLSATLGFKVSSSKTEVTKVVYTIKVPTNGTRSVLVYQPIVKFRFVGHGTIFEIEDGIDFFHPEIKLTDKPVCQTGFYYDQGYEDYRVALVDVPGFDAGAAAELEAIGVTEATQLAGLEYAAVEAMGIAQMSEGEFMEARALSIGHVRSVSESIDELENTFYPRAIEF